MLLSEGLFCIQVISRFSFSDFPGKLTRVVGEGVPRVAAGSRLLQLTVKTKKNAPSKGEGNDMAIETNPHLQNEITVLITMATVCVDGCLIAAY